MFACDVWREYIVLLYKRSSDYASANITIGLNISLENMMEHSIRKYINLVEGFDPTRHEMNPEQVRQLAEGALTVAVKYIQDHLGVETGDYAGVFFTGEAEDAINDILVQYINNELHHNQ